MPEFNKLKNEVVCLYCGKNKVTLDRWNKRCADCQKLDETITAVGSEVLKRTPAAVFENENGDKIYVDKFGKVVKDWSPVSNRKNKKIII